MPALSFMKCWREKVLSGEKRQTIRVKGKRVYKVGDTLHLFTGMRTKYCERLGRSTCRRVYTVRRWSLLVWDRLTAKGRWRKLSKREIGALARADGFEGIVDFDRWFRRYPPAKELQVVIWDELEEGAAA